MAQVMTKHCKCCGRRPAKPVKCVECWRNMCYTMLGLGQWRCTYHIENYGYVCNQCWYAGDYRMIGWSNTSQPSLSNDDDDQSIESRRTSSQVSHEATPISDRWSDRTDVNAYPETGELKSDSSYEMDCGVRPRYRPSRGSVSLNTNEDLPGTSQIPQDTHGSRTYWNWH